MQYVKLGSTGLEVSRVCLGCMTYGDPGRGNHEWTPGRGGVPAADPAGAGSGDHLLRHRERVLGRHQ